MFSKMLATFAALALLLLLAAAPSQAAPLFPLQLGGYYNFDGSDLSGHTWQASIWVVAQNVPLNGQAYFHIRKNDWEPFGWQRFYAQDLLIRSDDVAAYVSVGGTEWLQFQTTGIPQSWDYWDPPGQTVTYNHVQVNGVQSVTVPYGGPYQAYENQIVHHDPPDQSPPWYAYLVPNLGLIKTVQTDVPPGGTAMTQSLSQIDSRGVSLFPVTPRTRWTYNASDALGHTWQMKIVNLGQVILNGQAYAVIQRSNYDPYGGKVYSLNHMRVTAAQAFALEGGDEHLEFQVAGPDTQWNYPKSGGGTYYKRVNSISPTNAFEGRRFYLAYVTQESPDPALPQASSTYSYVVPGLGIAKIEDYNVANPGRAPLNFTLVSLDYQPVSNPGLMLLLLD